MKSVLPCLLSIAMLSTVFAEDRRDGKKRRSLIDSDPDVVYVTDLLPDKETVELSVISRGQVYATKNGGRSLGELSAGKVKLIGFDERACKVQGQGKIGWVRPDILQSEKGDLRELLKTVYEREMTVRNLIAEGVVALGMTRDEVCRVYGKPTKQKLRTTPQGASGTMEFIEYEEIDHFQPFIDPFSGGLFQRFTHTTLEEKSKIIVEFENDVASAIEESESESGGAVRVVSRPLFFFR